MGGARMRAKLRSSVMRKDVRRWHQQTAAQTLGCVGPGSIHTFDLVSRDVLRARRHAVAEGLFDCSIDDGA